MSNILAYIGFGILVVVNVGLLIINGLNQLQMHFFIQNTLNNRRSNEVPNGNQQSQPSPQQADQASAPVPHEYDDIINALAKRVAQKGYDSIGLTANKGKCTFEDMDTHQEITSFELVEDMLKQDCNKVADELAKQVVNKETKNASAKQN